MTTESDLGSAGSGDVRQARQAVEEFLARTQSPDREAQLEQWRESGRVDDQVAEQVARDAWDAVQDATPPAPDPVEGADTGAPSQDPPSPELAQRHRRAIAVARGLQELGYHLDETLRPGPDMAAG
ncbi:hypothetical protein ACIQM4_32070 [Streptomyces sp. NPDC091272]|uniref:hypothetical protein n=1 Tax=Streptomyces sp. NPDC091272 TaxID=3365981 RepID=UPI00380743D7